MITTLDSIYYMPGTTSSTLSILTHLICKTVLQNKYIITISGSTSDEETEVSQFHQLMNSKH
jgi:hypothetical protein